MFVVLSHYTRANNFTPREMITDTSWFKHLFYENLTYNKEDIFTICGKTDYGVKAVGAIGLPCGKTINAFDKNTIVTCTDAVLKRKPIHL